MKVIIFGIGFLGTKLMRFFSKENNVLGVDLNPKEDSIIKLDATNKREVEKFLILEKPDVVIDTIALTSSLACEKDPSLCKKLNYETTKNIAESCKRINAKMIFISSSYVFDCKKGNYSESDNPFPLGVYGKTKLLAEKEISKLKDYLILRVDIMYGYNGNGKGNGVFDMILSNNQIILREPNQLRQPVFVEDISRIILELINKNQRGIFHVAGPNKIYMTNFLKKLESIVRVNSKISSQNINNNFINVQIPFNSTLNTFKLNSLGIQTTPFEKALNILKEQIKINSQ